MLALYEFLIVIVKILVKEIVDENRYFLLEIVCRKFCSLDNDRDSMSAANNVSLLMSYIVAELLLCVEVIKHLLTH